MVFSIFVLATLFGVVAVAFLGVTAHFYLHVPANAKVEVHRQPSKHR